MNCRKMRRNTEGHMAKGTKKTATKAAKKAAGKYIRKPTKTSKKKAA
mgnify:FL=1